jgi:hypothetical protein
MTLKHVALQLVIPRGLVQRVGGQPSTLIHSIPSLKLLAPLHAVRRRSDSQYDRNSRSTTVLGV